MGKNKPWVYIAGPYTIGDQVQHTRKTVLVADQIVDYGVVPIVPHLSLAWDLACPRPPAFWYAYTLELLKRCDAIYRIPGESRGADREMEYAARNHYAILETEEALVEWCKRYGVK